MDPTIMVTESLMKCDMGMDEARELMHNGQEWRRGLHRKEYSMLGMEI